MNPAPPQQTPPLAHSRRPAPRLRVLSVAPMIDWTDKHCRRFHRALSQHTWLYTEMISTGALIHGDRARFLDFNPEEHPVAFQLGGSNPQELAQCARWVEAAGYDEVNLNCGCPSERVQRGAFGACLMAEPALVADCIKAMRDACGLEVTVKHRIGLDHDTSTAMVEEFIGQVAQAGCQTFVVHARNAVLKGLSPKQNREIPPLRYEVVQHLKRVFPHLQFIVNGGVATVADIEHHLQWADGCMLGRAAYTNPWLLSQFDAIIAKHNQAKPNPSKQHQQAQAAQIIGPNASHTNHHSPPSSLSRVEIIRSLKPYVEAQLQAGQNLRHIVQAWLGLFHGQPGGRLFRQVLSNPVQLQRQCWGVVEEALAVVGGGME